MLVKLLIDVLARTHEFNIRIENVTRPKTPKELRPADMTTK
jgi:hypothetical protein